MPSSLSGLSGSLGGDLRQSRALAGAEGGGHLQTPPVSACCVQGPCAAPPRVAPRPEPPTQRPQGLGGSQALMAQGGAGGWI